MPENLLLAFLIILPVIFLAGLVDAIAGGGGLLSVPAYLAAGLSPHHALANNKFSSCWGTMLATIKYYRGGLVDPPLALLSAFFALGGSFLGALAVLSVDPGFLRYLLLLLVPAIALLILLKPSMGRIDGSREVRTGAKYGTAALAALVIGFYDGFFGPGTGTFLIFFYTSALKFDFVRANANTKVVNLASNLAAVTTFLLRGKVLLLIAFPAALCGIAGNWVGARLVLKNGNRVVRPVFVIVLAGLLVKIVVDLLGNRV